MLDVNNLEDLTNLFVCHECRAHRDKIFTQKAVHLSCIEWHRIEADKKFTEELKRVACPALFESIQSL